MEGLLKESLYKLRQKFLEALLPESQRVIMQESMKFLDAFVRKCSVESLEQFLNKYLVDFREIYLNEFLKESPENLLKQPTTVTIYEKKSNKFLKESV